MNDKWTKVWINLIRHQIFNQLSTEWSCPAMQFMYRSQSIRHPLQSHHRSITVRTSPPFNGHRLLSHVQGILHHAAIPGNIIVTPTQRRSWTFIGKVWWSQVCDRTARWPYSHCARIMIILWEKCTWDYVVFWHWFRVIMLCLTRWPGPDRRQLLEDMVVIWC